MFFLKKEFCDQLMAEIGENNGIVLIEGAEFTPESILKSDPVVFELTYNEWCERQKTGKLEKAKKILNYLNNNERFGILKENYKRSAVIPFAGAGMSIPTGHIGWTDFLRKTAQDTHLDKNDFECHIAAYKYEKAAQLLLDDLGPSSFNEKIDNAFGHDKELAGAVRCLPYIFPTSVITTNFDNVLKNCYDKASRSFADVLLGTEATELPACIGQSKNVLVKLHGKAISERHRVLTFDEYDLHYNKVKSLPKCIDALIFKSLLFLGCSLGVDRILQCMRDITSERGANAIPRHYAFLQLTDENTRISREKELSKANIFPIWYTDDHDESIEALLLQLAEETNQ